MNLIEYSSSASKIYVFCCGWLIWACFDHVPLLKKNALCTTLSWYSLNTNQINYCYPYSSIVLLKGKLFVRIWWQCGFSTMTRWPCMVLAFRKQLMIIMMEVMSLLPKPSPDTTMINSCTTSSPMFINTHSGNQGYKNRWQNH